MPRMPKYLKREWAFFLGDHQREDWTRKVIPDALPRVLDGRVSIEDAMETAGNRKELEQVINDAEKNALRQSDDPLQTNQSAPIHFLAI